MVHRSDHLYDKESPMHLEAKVVISTLATLLASTALAIVVAVQADPSVIAGLPPTAQFLLLAAAPPIVTFLSGFAAPHTARPDLVARPGADGTYRT